MTNTDKLNKYIATLREQFPSYTYINSLTDECLESTLSASACDYAIIVKNIPRHRFAEFSAFVDERILTDLIEKDETLPYIIKLQRNDLVADDFVFSYNNPVCSYAADNYDYRLAA